MAYAEQQPPHDDDVELDQEAQFQKTLDAIHAVVPGEPGGRDEAHDHRPSAGQEPRSRAR